MYWFHGHCLIFRDSADYYSLHIAEDDGEVDLDFPCLDPKDNITKFGFSVLAIVEKNSSRVDSSVIISVYVFSNLLITLATLVHNIQIYFVFFYLSFCRNIPNEGVKKMKLETKQISIQELLGKVIKMLSASTRLSRECWNTLKNYFRRNLGEIWGKPDIRWHIPRRS